MSEFSSFNTLTGLHIRLQLTGNNFALTKQLVVCLNGQCRAQLKRFQTIGLSSNFFQQTYTSSLFCHIIRTYIVKSKYNSEPQKIKNKSTDQRTKNIKIESRNL